jgi:hypothetical protein
LQGDILSLKNERLEKRNWLIENFDFIFQQGTYYRTHKDMFRLKKKILWSLDELEGLVEVDEIT